MRFTFEAADAENFLETYCYYVGAMFDSTEDQIPSFIEKHMWVNGYGDEAPKFKQRCETVQKGNIFLIKRLLGRNQPKEMRVLAAGVVVGKHPLQENVFYVEWAMPKLDIIVPVKEIGTISARQQLQSLDPALIPIVKKCQARFLRWNLNVTSTTY